MDKLLHIIATPRGGDSRTLKISRVFIEDLKKRYPGCSVEELNLFEEQLQPLTMKMVGGKYALLSGREVDEKLKDAWRVIEKYINQFLSADIALISSPMWNFSIPYQLKQYIDIIVQPKYLFRYTEQGPEGLANGNKMVVVTSRGGDYSSSSPAASMDYQEPYLRSVFGFCGIKDIVFINAQPMDMGPELATKAFEKAAAEARKAAASI